VQFIAATHSPLVVSSVPNAAVYALRFDDRHRVSSHHLDLLERAGDADQILREVLGLPSTLPPWAEQRITAIVHSLSQAELDDQLIAKLRTELASMGLSHLLPSVVLAEHDQTI
jgi:hypothetical protein